MKRISAIILVLVLATFAVGCDTIPSATATTTTATTTAPTTTTVTESTDTTTTTVTTANDTTAAAETTTTTAATRRSTTTEKPASTTRTVTTKATAATTTVTTTARTTVTTTTTTATAAETKSYSEQVLALINQARAAEGLAPLTYRSDLQALADIRAAEIIESFSHTRPDGTSCFTVFEENNVSFRSVGENIASGHRTPDEVMRAWMNSDGHRANILGNFNGVVVGFNNYRWVQLFILA